ncbi:MAG: type III pantothenate kinase [Candidatus Omnitrophica bacterium]|nr:type III pantothenate kinase [Candidatus Omnitrophota bacterium]
MPVRILAVDVGNTAVSAAYFSEGRIRKRVHVKTRELEKRFLGVLKRDLELSRAEAVVIASVVPQAAHFLKTKLTRALGVKTLLIGEDLRAPIRNQYRNPKQVGMDRLMNAVAVVRQYKRDAIVVDFGTAITFDVVLGKGEYLGGAIAPGIGVSLEALFERTALLPRIKLVHPKGIIGRDTVDSIRAGCCYGIGGLCDRIIEEIQRFRRFKPLVIATGGYAAFMSRYCRHIQKIDRDLVLKGILYTYEHAVETLLSSKPLPTSPCQGRRRTILPLTRGSQRGFGD